MNCMLSKQQPLHSVSIQNLKIVLAGLLTEYLSSDIFRIKFMKLCYGAIQAINLIHCTVFN